MELPAFVDALQVVNDGASKSAGTDGHKQVLPATERPVAQPQVQALASVRVRLPGHDAQTQPQLGTENTVLVVLHVASV